MHSALSVSIALTLTAFEGSFPGCFLAEVNLKSSIFSGSRNEGSRERGARSFLGVERRA